MKYLFDERSDFLLYTCIWWKLPPWIWERLFCFLWNHPKSVMHTCEVFCSLEACNLHSICVPSTLSHWLTCSRKRSLCLGSNPWTCVKTSISSIMVPHLNSVVFNYKTTTWPCLSGTTCSHVCSRTSSCFGACYRSSSPENPATSSRRFVLQTFIFFLDSMSLEYPDTNQIWISGRYDGLEHFPRTIISVPRKPVKWMSWPTHPAGRPNIVVSWLGKLATSP